jgi:hypothetical protein
MHHPTQVRANERNVLQTNDNPKIAEWGNRAPAADKDRLYFELNCLGLGQRVVVLS